MNNKPHIGILGCAAIAEKYAIKAFQALDIVGKISIASRDREKAKKWAVKFQIGSHDSYEALLEDPSVDAIYIPLPISLHEEWALKAIEAKKHILCEKSLSGNLASVRRIVEGCKRNGLVLFENFMCDYHPQHEAVLDAIHQEAIGKPLVFRGYFGFPPFPRNNIRNRRELGGGGLNDIGAYTVFMARKILESEPEYITCRLEQDPITDVDVRGNAYLEFPSGKTAFASFGFDNVYQNNYSIWGSQGIISVDRAYSISPELEPIVTLYKNENQTATNDKIDVSPTNHFELIFDDFCKTILNDDLKHRQKKYDQIENQATVLEAMRLSSEKNKKIDIREVSQNAL